MALPHIWRRLNPLFNPAVKASCGYPAGHHCSRCLLRVCQLAIPCDRCGPQIERECQPIRKPVGRPRKPADPTKPRRKATQDKAAQGVQLWDSHIPCLFCKHQIFTGDVYCRRCGHSQIPLRSPLLRTVDRVASRERESPPKAKVIYLAHDFSFSEHRRTALLLPIVAALEFLGLDVCPAYGSGNQVPSSEPGWAYRAGQQTFTHIALADAVLTVVNGSPPDEGVMVDLGIAIALGKPTFLLRDDSRRVPGDEAYPMNLKLFVGMPREDWRDYYYTSVEEISAPGKALAQWARQ